MRRPLLALVSLAALLGGCAPRPPRAPEGWPQKTEWIVDGRTGERSSFDAMIDDLSGADVVFVGEDHDNPHHHELQKRVLDALAAKKNGMGLGMEMLQERSQKVADEFSEGKIDADALASEVDWKRTWGFPFAMYRPVLEVARAKKVALFALNADDEVVHKVSQKGLEGLTAEERAKVPELDLSSKEYRDFVREAFQGHMKMSEDRFERFFTAQVIWDETMASHTADAAKNRPMMVMAGTGHLLRRMGIPSRVERRLPSAKTRVLLPLAAGAKDRPDFKRSAREHEADWIVVTPDAPDPERS
ncbi:MAG TPA: ChaN family lipoprotein [bacterium]|nr:ChaN family lipoprotein [bacterium]